MNRILWILAITFSLNVFADEGLDRISALNSKAFYQYAQKWVCTGNTSNTCSKDLCKSIDKNSFFKLNFETNKYSRCDKSSCDDYDMNYNKSGIYTIIELPGRAAYLKVVNDGSDFIDVATAGTSVFLSFGSCEASSEK